MKKPRKTRRPDRDAGGHARARGKDDRDAAQPPDAPAGGDGGDGGDRDEEAPKSGESDTRLRPVTPPIGEGKGNLGRRQEWFRRRTGESG